MKKLCRLLSFLLILSFILTLLPVQTAYALPKSLNKARIHRLDDYRVAVAIRGMVFLGKLTNAKITDAKLDEFIKEVLAEMNLTEEEFDIYNDAIDTMEAHKKVTPEQIQKIKERILIIAGAVPGVGIYAAFAALVDKILSQDNLGAMEKASEISTRFMEMAGKELVPGTGTSAFRKASGPLKALIALYDAMVSDETAKRVYDRIKGLDAYRIINDFYGRLNAKVDKYYKENEADYVIVFNNAEGQPTWYFSLFGAVFPERWRLSMELHRVQADSKLNIDGKYKGNYTINIEYEISEMGVAVYNSERKLWLATKGETDGDAVLNSKGTAYGKRTLSGEAEALIMVYNPLVTNLRGSRCSIEPNQKSDVKNVGASGIQMTFYGYVPIVENDYADQDNIWMVNPNAEVVTTWDAEGDMYKRGNGATSHWLMSLMPMYSAYTPLY